MTLQEALNYFERRHPGASLIEIPEHSTSEVMCMIDPTEQHPNYSMAISAVSASQPHKHARSTVEYEVVEGAVLVDIEGRITTLYPREKITIQPGQVHSVSGIEDYSLIKIVCQPGWQRDDHIFV